MQNLRLADRVSHTFTFSMEPSRQGKTRRAEREGNWINVRAGKTGFDLNFVASPAKSNLTKTLILIRRLYLKNPIN